MFIYGKEEPLGKNRQLLALDENERKIVPSDYENAEMNRYSFVCLSRAEGLPLAVDTLLQSLMRSIASDVAWVWCWKLHDAYSATKAKVIVAKLNKAGWISVHRPPYVFAEKHCQPPSPNFFGPPAYASEDGGVVFCICNNLSSIEVLLDSSASMVLTWAAENKTILPSEQFVRWLARRDSTLIYSSKDNLGRSGIVTITPKRLPIAEWAEEGLIGLVYAGTNAESVWNLPP